MPDYEVIARKLDEAIISLREIVPTYQSVDDLQTEEDEALFVQAFRRLIRHINVLKSYTDFDWADLPINEREFDNYKSKYSDLYQKVKQENQKQKTSILNDIDFELELITRDRINVAYIFKLLAKLKLAKKSEAEAQKQAIIDLLGGEISLRSKRELIEKFIEENLPNIHDADMIEDEFLQYWQDQKVLALAKLCEEEKLDKEQFDALIKEYIYSGQEPIRDDVLKCLGNRPSLLHARTIGDRIIAKMHEFIEVFVHGMGMVA